MQTHIVFLRLKEQKTNGDLRSALRGLFTVSVNDNWRKTACQCGGILCCQSMYLVTHLTNTAVMSEQDGIGLHKGADENRRKLPLDMVKALAQLRLQG